MSKERLSLTKHPRVCMVLPYNPVAQMAGLEYATVTAARLLQQNSNTVSLYVLGSSGVVDGATVVGFKSYLALACAVARADADIFHWMEIWPSNASRLLQLTTSILLKLRRRTVVTTVATSGNILNRSGGRFQRSLFGWVNDRIVGLNDDQASELEAISISRNKFRLCPRGIEISQRTENDPRKHDLREKYGLPAEKVVVIFLGRLVKRKQPLALIKEWQALAELHSDGVLLIVGSGKYNDDSVESELTTLVAKTRAPILQRDWTDRPIEYLRASDIFVLLSEREGQPHALLQAMGCGLAVIVLNSSGLRHIVSHLATGIVIEKPSELGKSLRRLFKDRELRTQLGTNAAEFVRKEHGFAQVLQFHQALYRELTGRTAK